MEQLFLKAPRGERQHFQVLFPVSEKRSGNGHQDDRFTSNDPGGIKKTGTILVVDDEDHVRELCIDFLRVFGFETLSASNGYDAVRIFREYSDEIVCVLLDLTMPGA